MEWGGRRVEGRRRRGREEVVGREGVVERGEVVGRNRPALL